MDVDAIMQLFDFKTTYRFQTSPGIDQYNMPLYNTNGYPTQVQPGNQEISYYPVYQGFLAPAFVNGIQVPFFTDQGGFFNIWPNYIQPLNNSFFGDGGDTYILKTPFFPALAGHVDITGIIAANSSIDPIVAPVLNTNVPKTSTFPAVYITTQDINNNTIVVSDSGQFFASEAPIQGNTQLGLLTGAVVPSWGYSTNSINYATGEINVTFNQDIPAGMPINIHSYFVQQGIPRAILFYNNILTIRPPCDVSYLIEIEAYLTPAAFLSTSQSVPFAYMTEFIARGAARKLLSDTGDWEQFSAYEPLYLEQKMFVWKRSQRIQSTNRIPTIFSEFSSQSPSNNFSGGGN
jgi:hypothetical protein